MTDGRNPESICADCSSPNPTWASLNRGVLVCDDCCGVHRSLGRHISYIKSLHSTNWSPAVKEMVSSLVRKGANAIWEHALHDSSSSKVKIKKPGPRDKVHPNKHDFIVAKYKHLSLLPRMSVKDAANMAEDLSKQLHASVRTSNLETCLRLLSMGADPNYLHPDRGNTPLHVAAHANQSMQVELLVIYGANPMALDHLGHTPEECARIAGHHLLADRLIESQYELTDRLSFFLCGRKPVHSTGEHYLLPHATESTTEAGMEAKNKLKQLSNEIFEELASDIFDEVDRRETDAIWLTTQLLQDSVAFLPVNPAISPMRNQGRQKLATLDSKEFTQLVTDVLVDTKRRQNISLETGHCSGNVVPSSGGLAPDHDYDDVAMEEEGSRNEENGEIQLRKRSKLTPPVESTYSIIGEDIGGLPVPRIGDGDRYSRLRNRTQSNEGGGDDEGGEEGVASYSSLSSPDPTHHSKGIVHAEGTYSMIIESGGDTSRSPVVPKPYRGNKPPVLPARPITTYDRINKGGTRASLSSPSPTLQQGEESVSKKKFELIMGQLRKVQKEKEKLTVENQRLNEKVMELQKQLNQKITKTVELRNSMTPEPTTPKSPATSPLDSPPPPPPHASQPHLPAPPTGQQESIYSQVNKNRPSIKSTPPIKAPLTKTWSTPSYKGNPSSPLPHATTPPLTGPGGVASPPKKAAGQQTTSPLLEVNRDDELPPTHIEVTNEEGAPPVPMSNHDRLSKQPKPPVSTKPHPPPSQSPSAPPPSSEELPALDQIHQEIKSITLCIQELLKAGQTHRQNEFAICSLKITKAVDKLISMFPTHSSYQSVDNAVKEFSKASAQLKTECENSPSHHDQAYQTRLVMNSAYDVAKAARFLVTCVENAK